MCAESQLEPPLPMVYSLPPRAYTEARARATATTFSAQSRKNLCLTATLSDLVAYGEMTYSGRLTPIGQSSSEIAALIAELRELRWIPEPALQSHVGA